MPLSKWLIVCVVPALALCGPAAAERKQTAKPPAPKVETTGRGSAQPEKAPTRPPFTMEDQHAARVLGSHDLRFFADSDQDFTRAVGQTEGNWLLLSGGGADGAFGAGILSGWTALGTRPDFAVVTGVSAGALMAPFAFLGARFDARLAEDSTSLTSADVFEIGGAKDAMFDTWPLRKLLEKRITPELLREVAAAHARGRRLLVVTTNLDAGRPVVWNMGAIAAHGGEAALTLFRDVLLASSSIPGLFPPVAIEAQVGGRTIRELHGDGAITTPFFAAPPGVLTGTSKVKLPASQLYLIVNSRLETAFAMPERNTAAVLGRSIEIALGAGLRLQLAQLRAASSRQGATLHVAAINGDFPQHAAKGSFDQAHMQALFDYGAARSRAGQGFDTQDTAAASWQGLVRKIIGPPVARQGQPSGAGANTARTNSR